MKFDGMASHFVHNTLTEEKWSLNTIIRFFQGLHACFPNFSKVISEEEKLQEKYLYQPFILRGINIKMFEWKKRVKNKNDIVWGLFSLQYPIKSSFSTHKGQK